MRIGGPLVAAVLASGCATPAPQPTPTPDAPRDAVSDVTSWAEAAKDMVWQHIAQGEPPALELRRIEECDEFLIVMFAGPRDADGEALNQELLWAAGSLAQAPEGADGGWANSPDDAVFDSYRDEHRPCEVTVGD